MICSTEALSFGRPAALRLLGREINLEFVGLQADNDLTEVAQEDHLPTRKDRTAQNLHGRC